MEAYRPRPRVPPIGSSGWTRKTHENQPGPQHQEMFFTQAEKLRSFVTEKFFLINTKIQILFYIP